MRPLAHSRRIAILVAILIASATLTAQQPATIQKKNGVYTYRADTHLVLLDVTVTDKHGHPVTGLTSGDFKLLEDGQPQTIKFFEEHTPVDPAEIARQKAASLAARQPNTFNNYEPLTGRPVTVLLLNELFTLPNWDYNPLLPLASPLRQRMIEAVQNAPPNTPFAIYMLDSELQLVQPITTDRALLLARIDVLWKTPHFGSEQMINPTGRFDTHGMPPPEDIPVRRTILSDAMRQLASSLKAQPGRKNLFVFTGGFQCSVVESPMCPYLPFPKDSLEYLCGLMDTLEQVRMSIYRYYPHETGYGFGCPASTDLGTSANYYTLYYTPANTDWNGNYRATTVGIADKSLRLLYRKGYYATPENVDAHYYASKRTPSAPEPGAPPSDGPTIAATVVAAEQPDPATAGSVETASTQGIQLHRRGSEPLATPKPPPNPAAAVFSVQVIPAETTVVPASAKSSADKEMQEYRQLTLHVSIPASEFKVVQADSGLYGAQLEMAAVAYAGGRLASENGSQSVQMVVNFNGVTDPRIATSTIAATLNVNILEHDKNRWVYVSVRDRSTGQFGSLVIPMNQVN